MSASIAYDPDPRPSLSRRSRLILTVLASVVLLIALGVAEVGVLAAFSVVARTHHASTQ